MYQAAKDLRVPAHPLHRHGTGGAGRPGKPRCAEGPWEHPAEGAAGRGGALTPAAVLPPQVEGSPSLRWQMALYRGLPGREEDADDPEKIDLQRKKKKDAYMATRRLSPDAFLES